MSVKSINIILFGFLALINILGITANAEDNNEEKFSKYTGPFTVSTIYGTPRVTRFNGDVLVTGQMVFRFDRITETEIGELMFADFIPDEELLSMFPQVEDGFYPKPLTSISIINADEALNKVLDAEALQSMKHSTSGVISKRGSVMLNEYSIFVECDSRQYTAYIVSFVTESEIILTEDKKGLSGC